MAKALKYCLITGVTDGIGHETALGLLQRDYHVVSSLSPGKSLGDAFGRFPASYSSQLTFYSCDLASQNAVRSFCRSLKESIPRLDNCIHNAGAVYGKYTLTEDGIESQWAVNYLAPYMITLLLFDLLSPEARIIFTSTRAHYRSSPEWDKVMDPASYSASRAYARSKLALMTFFTALSRETEGSGRKVIAYHPGLVDTRIGNKHMNALQEFLWNLMRRLGKSPERAARYAIELATDAGSVRAVNGKYYAGAKPARPSKSCMRDEVIDALLEYSAELTGIHYNELPAI